MKLVIFDLFNAQIGELNVDMIEQIPKRILFKHFL